MYSIQKLLKIYGITITLPYYGTHNIDLDTFFPVIFILSKDILI